MRIWSSLRTILAFLLRRPQVERDIEEELCSHLRSRADDLERQGLSRAKAERQARVEFGGYQRYKEECREALGTRLLEELIADLRFGMRQLRRNPGFTAVAVITLAIGIGANTAIFSVVDSVLLAPLPYPSSNRLVVIWETLPRSRRIAAISFPNFRDWQRDARSFERMAGLGWSDYELTSPGTPEHVWGMEVSSGFFSTLGAKLALGREFTAQEDQPGGARVAIISNRMWKNRFAGNHQVLGKILALNGVDRTIVGVAPPQFNLYGYAAYWPNVYTPLAQRSPAFLNHRGSHIGLLSVARLRPGISLAEAQGEMSAIQGHLDQLYPSSDRGLGAKLVSLKQQVAGHVKGTLLLLFGAVGLVLLIACANVANLLLARSAARAREFAIRSALGAGRRRVVRQLLTESTLLAMAGGALGFLIAAWGVKPVLAVLPASLPRSYEIRVSLPVLLFAFGLAVAVGILFGLAPALKGSRSNLEETLKEAGRTASGRRHRAQNSLVLFQMALTVVLLTAAGLLLHTIRRLRGTNPGFDPHHVVTFNVGFSPSATKTGATTRGAYTPEQSYFPLYQVPNHYWSEGQLGSMAVIVRTPLAPAIVMPEIKKVVYGADRQQTVYDVQTMEQILSGSMWQQRFPMILLGIFAGLALLLASVGIYGVISYSVTQRVHEIGIRMALGAQKRDVFRMVIGQGLRLALAGLAIGAAVALIFTRAISSFSNLIYEVGPTDPLTFVAVSLILLGVALLACYVPARRATKVDPTVALRHE